MENQYYQYYHLSFNQYYIHLADVFTRFCLTMGQLNPALLTDYIPHIHLERQLTYIGLSFSSRFFYHHLLAGPCIYQCSFCAIVAQFPLRIHRERHCSYCRGHRRLHRHTYRRNRVQIHPVHTTCSLCTLYLPMEPSRSSIYLSPIPVTFIISSYNLSRPILNNTDFKRTSLHCFN